MIKKFTKEAAPQRSPRSHDFGPGNTQVFQPGKYRDYYKVETNYPSNHPEYTHQTDQFNNSISESMSRGLSDEQLFQLLKRTKGMTREQFDRLLNRSASISQDMVEKIKGTDTVKQIFKDRDPNELVDIEERNLGNGALAETLPDGTILINDDVDEVGDWEASRLVHELAHHVDWKEENYLDKKEERDAFQKQVQYLVEKGYSLDEITEWLLPIFCEYKDESESKILLNKMYQESVKSLKSIAKIAQAPQRVNLQFTPEEKAILDKIEGAADKLGIKVFLAGGIVRDKLLGIPNDDLDFVCNKDSERLAGYLVKTYGLSDAIKMDRSGAIMIYMDGKYIDIIDAKRVFSSVNVAGPESLEQGQEAEMSIFLDDAYRRDISINSLMYGLHNNKLYDPTGKGLHDLQNRIIRTIIDPYLKLRAHAADMLRMIRFYATKPNFKFAPNLLDAMKKNVHRLTPRQDHGDLSSRRIERELRKAKADEEWAKMKGVLTEIGADKYIAKEIKAVDDDKKGNIEYGFEK